MFEAKDLRKMERSMIRAVFRGAFWAVILGGFVLSAIEWIVLSMVAAGAP